MAPVIEVTDLCKSYGSAVVLDRLSMTVTGGVYCLLGPNGAGKTTLVNLLTTLLQPDSGAIRVRGVPITRRRRIRQLVSVTGQFAAVDELLTARENLVLVGRLLGLSARGARDRADELIAAFAMGREAHTLVRNLSGGTARRVELAMSLVVRPAVLFLDEPTTGLDPASRRRLWADIRDLAANGTTVFLTTQYLEEAEALADTIGVLASGRIVAEGTAAELVAVVGGEELVLVDADGEPVRTLTTDGTAGGLATALLDLRPADAGLRVQLRAPTLEDAFTALTTRIEETAA